MMARATRTAAEENKGAYTLAVHNELPRSGLSKSFLSKFSAGKCIPFVK